MEDEPVKIQREYYRVTSTEYDTMHVSDSDEHTFALTFLAAMIDFFDIRSVLDIGSGTGRALLALKRVRPGLKVFGVEPSAELREVGYSKGISREELVDGDAQRLAFPDGAFDLVCEFAALYHIPSPRLAVQEMLRVSSRAVFISDSNNFGQGSPVSRLVKQTIRAFGLWPLADFVKTRGKGYTVSAGDGLAYSYSVFSDYPLIARECRNVYLLNTAGRGMNHYREASHVALLGVK